MAQIALSTLSQVALGQPHTHTHTHTHTRLFQTRCGWLGLPEAGRLPSSGLVPATLPEPSREDREGTGTMEEALGQTHDPCLHCH